MKLTKIVRFKNFRLAMEAMGFNRTEIVRISKEIAADRDLWPIIPGMRGARKARIGLPNTGKRDGGRVIYYIAIEERVFLLFAYPKSAQSDLSESQRRALIAVIEKIKRQT